MVPDAWAFAGQLHVDWLSLATVRAEVAAAVLELLQVFDGVDAAGSGHSPHAKGQGHLYVDTHVSTITSHKLHYQYKTFKIVFPKIIRGISTRR